MAMSAYLPGSSVPLTSSSKLSHAPSRAAQAKASIRESACAVPRGSSDSAVLRATTCQMGSNMLGGTLSVANAT